MLAFIIAPFIIALLIFILIRIIKFLQVYKIKGIIITKYLIGFFLFSGLFAIIFGFFLPNNTSLKRALTKLGFYWLGFMLYFFVGLAIALLVRIIIWSFTKNKGYSIAKARNITVLFVFLFTAIMSIYGIANAHKLKTTVYEVEINKETSLNDLNVVLVSDLHLGYNVGLKQVQDMVEKINVLNPDVVIIAGDIFDNEYEAIYEPETIIEELNKINAKYGKYATFGNHDIQEKILVGFTFDWINKDVQADERMINFIKASGFELLYDSYALIEDSVYIYGRPDAVKFNLGNNKRIAAENITNGLDKDKAIICIDHQPGELKQLANAGVDLDLSGHTHNGQVWSGTISINWFWDNPYGLKKIENMTSIVTSGVGLFGVNMRTGCYAEVVNIKINFKK